MRVSTGGQLGEKEECLPWFWGREIVTAWLELRGAQAKGEFFSPLRTEGPRYHMG